MVAKIIVIAVIVFWVFLLTNILIQIANLLSTKVEINISEKKLIDTQTEAMKSPEIDYGIRAQYNNELLLLINTLIETEVTSKLKSIIMLNGKYEVLKIEDDIKEISTTVFESIKDNIYDDKYNIFTGKYIMNYITKVTSLVILSEYRNIQNRNNSDL